MNQITITITELGNDAFFKAQEREIADCLRRLATRFENGESPSKVMDLNGNSVGTVEIE